MKKIMYWIALATMIISGWVYIFTIYKTDRVDVDCDKIYDKYNSVTTMEFNKYLEFCRGVNEDADE